MQRLNLRNPKPYDYSNEANTVNPRAKFYCVSEGPTEESYFEGIRNNRGKLGIKSDVYIEIVKKQEGQETYSHPEQLVNACLVALGRIDAQGNEIEESEWKNHCKWEEYDSEVDCVCVIFDRDYRNITEKLPELYRLCEKHKIYIAISNPNFELWLLMHFSEIKSYDRDLLHSNPKNLRHELFPQYSKDKKYLEIILSFVADGYKKGCRIDFEKYVDNIEVAIKQASEFCEEPERLIDELGTSVGQLVRKMQTC